MTKVHGGIVQSDTEPEFDGPGTAVADLLETTPLSVDITSPKEIGDTLTEIMELYIRDYAVLIGEKYNHLNANSLPTDTSLPLVSQKLIPYVPYLRFGEGMQLKTAPLTIPQLKDFIGRTDPDLAYLIDHGDIVEKGLIKDGFNLESDSIKTRGNKIIWTPPHQDMLLLLNQNSCKYNLAIPNFNFLSLFIENGEVLRNYLNYFYSNIGNGISEDKYSQTHYFNGMYYSKNLVLNFRGKNPLNLTKIELTIPELRKFSEGTGEKRIADLMTEIPDFYSALHNITHDFSSAKDFLYTKLKKHTPQLTI